jgi:hypothetical protein
MFQRKRPGSTEKARFNGIGQLQRNVAPEGRTKIAQRFSAGKSGIDDQVPEGRPSFHVSSVGQQGISPPFETLIWEKDPSKSELKTLITVSAWSGRRRHDNEQRVQTIAVGDLAKRAAVDSTWPRSGL